MIRASQKDLLKELPKGPHFECSLSPRASAAPFCGTYVASILGHLSTRYMPLNYEKVEVCFGRVNTCEILDRVQWRPKEIMNFTQLEETIWDMHIYRQPPKLNVENMFLNVLLSKCNFSLYCLWCFGKTEYGICVLWTSHIPSPGDTNWNNFSKLRKSFRLCSKMK